MGYPYPKFCLCAFFGALDSPMATAALSHKLGEHKIPRITTWAPTVCRIMAFYGCWAIISPIFGGLGTLETCSFAHVERMRKRAFLKIGFGFDIDAFRCRVSRLYTQL